MKVKLINTIDYLKRVYPYILFLQFIFKTDRYDIAKILCQILFFSKILVTWKNEELSQIKTYTIIHMTGWSRYKKRKKKKINDRATIF
jgi:hypothetical protein